MAVLAILACVLWLLSWWSLFGRPILGPVISFVALWVLSLAGSGGLQLVPVNGTMLIGWLAITLVVSAVTLMQPVAIRQQTRGTGYMLGGALTGMVLSLCGNYVTSDPSLFNGIMIICTAAGTFLGYYLFTRTPEGGAVRPGSGNFFRYLLAKGFPVAVSVMMAGLAAVLIVLKTGMNGL